MRVFAHSGESPFKALKYSFNECTAVFAANPRKMRILRVGAVSPARIVGVAG
jgi:hypothetical protein